MADHDIDKGPKPAAELADEEQEHGGGGRFNRRLLMTGAPSRWWSGWSWSEASDRRREDDDRASSAADRCGANPAHDKAEIEELAAGGRRPQRHRVRQCRPR